MRNLSEILPLKAYIAQLGLVSEHINRYKLYFSPPFLGKANSNMLRPQILRKLIHEVEVLIV